LGQLQSITDELTELGFKIIAISPDTPANLDSVKKEQSGVVYTLLSDSKMKAAGAFGVAFRLDDETNVKFQEYGIDLEKASGEKHHLLPVPSIFLTDDKGRIAFQHVDPNYRVRLAPEVLLSAARAAAKAAK